MKPSTVLWLLRLSAFLIFIGRAYQFLFWDAPFRAILWDEDLLSPIIEGIFNTPWEEYVTSMAVDSWIQNTIKAVGGIFAIASVGAWLINMKNYKWWRIPIILGIIGLTLLAIAIVKDKNLDLFQFFELSIQIGTPTLLLLYFRKGFTIKHLELGLKVIIALTFIPHGLFAMGLIYLPGTFIDMTIKILGINEDAATQFLFVVGLLDLILSIAIFIPKIDRYFLAYAALWGFATALARIVSGYDPNFLALSFNLHLHTTIYRLPHGLIPLAALFIVAPIAFPKHAISKL